MTSWRDLTSKSDIFYNNLPLFNKKGALEDNYSFKLNAKPKNGKYSFSANHTNGERGKVEFSGSETYTKYHDTELGYKINNRPGVELSAKLTESLLTVNGLSLTLNLTAAEKEERASFKLNYASRHLSSVFGVSIPLPHRVFNLPVNKEGDEKHNKTVNAEVLYNFDKEHNYFVGVDGTYKLPNEGEEPKYDVRGVIANRNSDFEGGLYVRRSTGSEKEKSSIVGAYSTVKGRDDVTISSNFSVETNKKEFNLDNFASFKSGDNTYLLGVQVFPKTTVSFGLERAIDKNTKLSFAYAYVISREENIKSNAVRFGVELTI